MVLLDTGTSGISREIYSEDADDGTRTSPEDCCRTSLAQYEKLRDIGIIFFHADNYTDLVENFQ